MRKLITISLLVVSFCASGQKAKGPIMHWRDYSAKDNAYPASDYSLSIKRRYSAISLNNDSSIYIDLIVPDPEVQRQILSFGMNIWIDNSGKEAKTMGVRYPLGSNSVKADLNRKGEERSDSEELMLLRNSSLEMAYEIEVGGLGEDIPPESNRRVAMDLVHLYDIAMMGTFLQDGSSCKEYCFTGGQGKVVPFSIGIEYGNVMASIPKSASSDVTRTVTITGYHVVRVPVGDLREGNSPSVSAAAQRSAQAYGPTTGSTSGKSSASPGKSIVTEPSKPIWIKGLLLATK